MSSVVPRRLLASSIVAAGVLVDVDGRASEPAPSVAAKGAFDLEIAGESRFGVEAGGPVGSALRRPDLIAETDLYVTAFRDDEERSLYYGAGISFTGDADETFDVDDALLFVEGAWGQVTLGEAGSPTSGVGTGADYDGTVFAGYYGGLGAQTLSAGTGGIDGDLTESSPTGFAYSVADSSDAAKIRYDSPVLGTGTAGAVVSLAFTPDTGAFGGEDRPVADDGDLQRVVEAAVLQGWAWDGGHLIVGATTAIGELEDDAATGRRREGFVDVGVGGELVVGTVGVAAAIGRNQSDPADWASIGIGWRGGRANASLNVGWSQTPELRPLEVIAGLDVGIATGVYVAADLGWIDPDEADPFVTGLARLTVSY